MNQETQALLALLALPALQGPMGRPERLAQWGRLARQEATAQQELQGQLATLEPAELSELLAQPALSELLAPPVLRGPKA